MTAPSQFPSLSVVVPTLNEEGNVAPLARRIATSLNSSHIEFEIIFVDDNSSDATQEEINSLIDTLPVTLIIKNGSAGKADSLLYGFTQAQFPIVCMIDADLQYAPEEIPRMLSKTRAGADIVVANRIVRKGPLLRTVASQVFFFTFVRLLHNLNVDSQSGLKIFRKSVLDSLELHPTPWTFDLEFLVKARDKGFKIETVDITYFPRLAGKEKIKLIRSSVEIASAAVSLKRQQFKKLRPEFRPRPVPRPSLG